MAEVNTVLGPIHSEDLGVTLIHEHLVIGFPGWRCDPLAGPPDRKKIINTCLKALEPAKNSGLDSLVDVTPPDLSRDVDILKEVSEKSGINIICATGRYDEEKGAWTYLKFKTQGDSHAIREELYEGFMQEITVGIGPSRIKPGVIKVATGLGRITPCEEVMLQAAARACTETGTPIISHTENGTMGPEQAALLISEGAEPKKILIGHMCGNRSISYQKEVLGKGVNIALDRFGIEIFVSDTERLVTLKALLEENYADRVMISHDHVSALFGRGNLWPAHLLPFTRHWSFSYILEHLIPLLKESGVDESQIRLMMIENPRRFLGGE
ncbi:MAG: hypothetical protein M0P57_04625 [Syntrophales bacterium]|jgi:phosphotriesterase-related protein|nr:hypothetical protein [Syntrophales bacterium]MDY0043445.1 hypothetical protein [Syntrophales bacterium]